MSEGQRVNSVQFHPREERDSSNPHANVAILSKRTLGYGNEMAVRPLLMRFGEWLKKAKVGKRGNNAFFGWQKKTYADIKRYLDVLDKKEIRVSKSVELIEDPEVWHVRDCTYMQLIENLIGNASVGKILKFLTKQYGRRKGFMIVEDERVPNPLNVSSLEDREWLGPEICELLAKGEEILKEDGLFIDPLGGAAISAALRFLANPTGELIMSNLETEAVDDEDPDAGEQMILADFGLMDVGDPERVYEIPHTQEAMGASLGFLGHLGFEALNMTLREHKYGEAPFNVKPRPLHLENAIPKAVAWLGCSTVFQARRHWYHGEKNIASWVYALGQSVSHLG